MTLKRRRSISIDCNCTLNWTLISQLYSASYRIPYEYSQYTLELLYNNSKMMDFETLAKSTQIPPGLTSSSSVGPIPTVIPGPSASLQEVHTTGKRTLWYVILHWMRVDS